MRLRAPDGRPWTLKEIIQGQPLGHPSHALLVHYPVALPPVAVALDVWARLAGGDPSLVAASAYLTVAALALGLVAAVPGLVDWWGMIPGSRKRRFGTIHLLIQSSSLGLLALAAALRWPAREAPIAPELATVVTVVATLTLLVGNYFGGELVYRMGMRVSTGAGASDHTPERLRRE